MEKYASVILAAGKGTRMNEGQASEIPKVMFRLFGKPIIDYSVGIIEKAGIKKIIVVIGYKKEMITDYLRDRVEYAEQIEQLGTGHAVMMVEDTLRGKSESVIVSYGDSPLYKSETLEKLLKYYEEEQPTIAMLSVILKDPNFWAFGRVIRNDQNEVIGINEQKDCSEAELKIKESNSGFYIFKADWLWENLLKIEANNVQKEYYLTDLIKLAVNDGKKIIALPVSEEAEAMGINTPEQLKEAEEVLKKRAN